MLFDVSSFRLQSSIFGRQDRGFVDLTTTGLQCSGTRTRYNGARIFNARKDYISSLCYGVMSNVGPGSSQW